MSKQIPTQRLVALVAIAIVSLSAAPSVQAQVAPVPTTTYTNTGDGLWVTPGNWDNGVPTGTPSTQTGDNAKIGDNQTALWQQNLNGDPAFGTLTLGVDSHLRYQAINNGGLPSGAHVYFSDGSHFQYISGTSNRDDNLIILPGASARFSTATNQINRGTLSGSGDIEWILAGNFEMRRQTAGALGNFTGNQTFSSNGTASRGLTNLGQFGGTENFGSGTNTISNNVYIVQAQSNRMNDAGTLNLVGGSGSNNAKWRLPGVETIANLIIESPTQGATPYLITGNSTNSGQVRVTDTVTFQGTGGTIEIQSVMGGEFGGFARVSGVDINANNFEFGAGDWTINGSKNTGASGQPENFAIGSIGVVGGGDVTTAAGANVTVNAAFDAPDGFNKEGDGTLTLNHTDPVRTVQGGTQNFNPKGLINVNGGTLVINSEIAASVNVAAGGTLGGTGTINGATTILGTHAPGTSPGIQTFGTDLTYSGGGSVVQWDLIGNTTVNAANPNALFDQIIVGRNLDFADPTSLELSFNGAGSGVDWTDPFWGVSKTETNGWLLYDVAGTTTGFNNLSIATSNWEDSLGNFFDTELLAGSFSLFQEGQNIYLNFTAIPEPSTALLAGLGILSVFMRRRRK